MDNNSTAWRDQTVHADGGVLRNEMRRERGEKDKTVTYADLISLYNTTLRGQELDELRQQAAQFAADAIWERTAEGRTRIGRRGPDGPRSRYEVYLLTGRYPLDPATEVRCWTLDVQQRMDQQFVPAFRSPWPEQVRHEVEATDA